MGKKLQKRLSLVFLSGFLAGGVSVSYGNQTLPQPEKKPAKPSAPVKPEPPAADAARAPIYKPPLRGAPSGRVAGGTRGGPSADRSIWLCVLTPDHPGLTTQEQPSLYWFISQPTTAITELTITENQAGKPVLETQISSPSQRGIQRIRLADYGVRLQPGVVYRWYIAVVADRKIPGKELLAGGLIERIEPGESLRARLVQTSKVELAFVYAEEGIWYDALLEISERIDAAPNDSALRAQRDSLLEQIGLPEVADAERRFRS